MNNLRNFMVNFAFSCFLVLNIHGGCFVQGLGTRGAQGGGFVQGLETRGAKEGALCKV